MNTLGNSEIHPTSIAEYFGDDFSLRESYLGFEFLKKFPSWIGSDICVVGDSIIQPGEETHIHVLLKKEHFPKVGDGEIFR